MTITSDRALAGWIEGRRWFGGKGAAIASLRELDAATLSPELRVVALEVGYADAARPSETYLLPMRPGSDRLPQDALDQDEAALSLLDLVRHAGFVQTTRGKLKGERFEPKGRASPLDLLPARPAVRRLSAEQSNTSIVFDDRVILKLIRKLSPGTNPELEIGAFLSRHGFTATPPLLGAISLSGEADGTVAVAHAFVRVDADGWAYVRDAFAAHAAPPAELLRELGELGARVGEFHAALASSPSDPAFAPEPFGSTELSALQSSLRTELARTLALAQGQVPGLSARRPALEAQLEALAQLSPGGVRIRQHGDLHLGQVLRSEGRWLLFDFEGEPARTPAERRAKQCPLRDVAGMLRSFAYAEGAAEQDGAPRGSRAAQAREAFLTAWRAQAGHLAPQDPAAFAALLRAFELEKLLYELRYELGHRPDWVRIPARDLLSEAA